ncbi:pentapeptide repeat-containing protein [Streptomyces bicolor]|uniref:pentapeptide repeat-containing protein n=1 Tax=Streptomyces bicolor TaxID=66874 RepID=UPI0007C59AED|nr:pentapeptide repeat-containing protein [Streptomyces bicolor]
MAHLDTTSAQSYFDNLGPGHTADYRGVEFTESLLGRLLEKLQVDGRPHLHNAKFNGAKFAGAADFSKVDFSGDVAFTGAEFTGDALFSRAVFSQSAWFENVKFAGLVRFSGARFKGGDARFSESEFMRNVRFDDVTFNHAARFNGATFRASSRLGPLRAAELELTGALFLAPLTIEAAANSVLCQGTRWEAATIMRLRYALVDLSNAAPTQPTAISAHPSPFEGLDETPLTPSGADAAPAVCLLSLQGADVSQLVLNNVDMKRCTFSGAFHLDQLRLEGGCEFSRPPTWICGVWPPRRWSKRITIAEENRWRATAKGRWKKRRYPGWSYEQGDPEPVNEPTPETLSVVYRQLRKGFEDSKNEPDAADFYYGEMEMRKRDKRRPWVERRLLGVYWLVSGYGLRAARAFACLITAMAVTALALMLWGLPNGSLQPKTTGKVTGQNISLKTEQPSPELTLTGKNRISWDRTEKAIRVTLNAAIFRSPSQNLTTLGTFIEMAARFIEPVLLALAILAIRGRIRR